MGLSSKKQTTTQNTSQNTLENTTNNVTGTTNNTTTANNPAWVTDSIQGLLGQIGALSSQDPSQYVPGASTLQQQAFTQAGGLSPSSLYGDAAGIAKGAIGAGAPGMIAARLGPTSLVGAPQLGPAATASTERFDASSIAPTERVNASSLLEGLQGYVNPLLENVVSTSLTGYDKDAAAKQAQFAAKGALNKAFGGSRFGLAEGQLGADLVDNRAATEAGLRSDAYDKAFANSNLDAGRRQDASTTNAQIAAQQAALNAQLAQAAAAANAGAANEASMFNAGQSNSMAQLLAQLQQQQGTTNAGALNTAGLAQAGFNQDASKTNLGSMNDALTRALSGAGLLGNLGTAQDASARDNVSLLAGLGGTQRDIATDQAQAPLTLLQLQQALTSGLPLSIFGGQTSTGNTTGTTTGSSTGSTTGTSTGTTVSNPSLLAGIGQGAQTAASLAALFSDRRLKRNIKPLGERNGLKWYRYNYVWGGPKHEGVMADEVVQVKPEAVSRHESGFLMVDYGRI